MNRRGARRLALIVGWLLTPVAAWAVSLLGAWIGALVGARWGRGFAGVVWLAAGAVLGAVAGVVLWVLAVRAAGRKLEVD